MIRFKKLILILASVTLSAGCGKVLNGPNMQDAYPRIPVVASDSARLFFIRPGEKAVGSDARIYLDETKVVELPFSGCYYFDTLATKHSLKLDLWGGIGSHRLEINPAPGSTLYFKVWPRQSRKTAMFLGVVGGLVESGISESQNNGEMEFIPLSESEARKLFAQCVLYDPSRNQ